MMRRREVETMAGRRDRWQHGDRSWTVAGPPTPLLTARRRYPLRHSRNGARLHLIPHLSPYCPRVDWIRHRFRWLPSFPLGRPTQVRYCTSAYGRANTRLEWCDSRRRIRMMGRRRDAGFEGIGDQMRNVDGAPDGRGRCCCHSILIRLRWCKSRIVQRYSDYRRRGGRCESAIRTRRRRWRTMGLGSGPAHRALTHAPSVCTL